MKKSLAKKPFFDQFVEVDQFFKARDIPIVLTVLADGIEVFPEWVRYIKENQHRYKIAIHGWNHINYRNISADEGYELLKRAKETVEDTFCTKVFRWYAPFSIRGFPDWGDEVCERLGIRFHTRGGTIPHYFFHYWEPRSVQKIKKVVNALQYEKTVGKVAFDD